MRNTPFRKSLPSNQKDTPLRRNHSAGTSVSLYDRFVLKQPLPSREDSYIYDFVFRSVSEI